jgi:HK97 family phage prohead protease
VGVETVKTAEFEFGVKAISVEEADDGTIFLEGYASDFGVDRDMEAFEPGAFDRGLKAFLENPVFMLQHKPDQQLGVIRDARLLDDGLHIKAEFPKPPESAGWAMHAYNLAKRGMLRGFSVGGKFSRRMTPAGPRIFDVDLREISLASIPVNPRTLGQVVGKAFGDEPDTEMATNLDRLDSIFKVLEEHIGA